MTDEKNPSGPSSLDDASQAKEGARPREVAPDTLPLLAEELSVERREIETGRVRVRTVTREHEEFVDEPVVHTHVEVQHVPVNRPVETIPSVRQDGDITIVPIVEETLVIERRLMLREELHIRRAHTTGRYQERVTLRRQEAVVTRTPSEPPQSESASTSGADSRRSSGGYPAEDKHMAYETLVAVFDTPEHARAAIDALKVGGFHEDDISMFDRARLTAGGSAMATSAKEPGVWRRLFGGDLYQHEAEVYGDTIERGGVVVSLRVLDSEVAHATGILDLHRPIDVHDRALTSGIAPVAKVEAAMAAVTAPITTTQTVAVTPKIAATHDEVLRLAEEQLQVGKRLVETGTTRVRRFTTEREVAQDVTLHEEHAEVLRRAITDPAYVGDIDWSDRAIEVAETAEQALVSKTARVVEEISLKNVGTEHIETVHEKLRRQQAEVTRVDASGRPIATPRP